MIFRRHRSRCHLRRAGRRAWGCACPIWIDARMNGKRLLTSMNLTDWQEAQVLAQEWEKQGVATLKAETATSVQKEGDISLEQAWENFLARAKARNLRPATLAKYALLRREM